MRRLLGLLLALVLLSGGAVACNKKNDNNTTSTGPVATASSATADSCASAGTRHLPKTRLVADLAISAGAFHRYIYKPIKAKSFQQSGKLGKAKILIKGALAAGAIKHFMGNAIDNARADPTFCKYVPTMDQIQAKLSILSSKLKRGDTSQVDSENSLFSQLQSKAGFTPNDNTSLPGVG